VDWDNPAVQPVYQASVGYAQAARAIAARTGQCDPDVAWAAGLLAPLGWLAACAVAPDRVAACLADPDLARDPGAVQRRHWGRDQAAIGRRLARRWRLPAWLAPVVGHPDLPVETARTVGADVTLFRTVQLAIAGVEREQRALCLLAGVNVEACGVPPIVFQEEATPVQAANDCAPASVRASWPAGRRARPPRWVNPKTVPLLCDLLVLAAENRRSRSTPVLAGLEQEVDALHRALQEVLAGEEERLRVRKLAALAELAAGAGHEINNPLAVISGQAQYLLHHESEPARQQALQTIVAQAQRIHEILSELRQFARPAPPQKQPLDLLALVHDVFACLAEFAAQRQVQLLCPLPQHTAHLRGDPRQLHVALSCLVRNGIEAAPADGWVSVRVEACEPEAVHVIVEDSGPGPLPAQCEHLFDPFYSGRQAGRGRGLGLPTAWRLAREHGGDVYFDADPGGPTRFVLTLPGSDQGSGERRGVSPPIRRAARRKPAGQASGAA
jgi:signal transduction histidine kinase